jgi:2-oxoisovalerate dehydrogenase E1 component
MPLFRDSEHLYGILDAFFTRMREQEAIASAMLAGKFVLRFRYTEPDGQVTVDLRGDELTWKFGKVDLDPDLEMIQRADIAHRFWMGKLSVPRALATRQVVSRGDVAKALKLLPALKPAYPLYANVLEELGESELLHALDAPASAGGGVFRKLRGALPRRLLPRNLLRKKQRIDYASLPPCPLLAEREDASPVAIRVTNRPSKETDLKREMLSRMMLIRAFEQCLSAAYASGDVPTEAIHLSIGQEAVAVGACFALRDDDYIATTHRGHGHMLAKGADLQGMMSEMFAKADGLCGGKGGSMHVTDASVGALGANGIVGASLLIAAGAAHAARLAGSDRVAVAFMGDGATNQGMFHEGLNFASVLDLPVVFCVENNLYGEFTPIEKHMRAPTIAERAAAYGIPGISVDGNDVWAVFQAVRRAVERARRGDGPTLLECRTYRWHGHMEGENAGYRTQDEVDAWKEKCPIRAWRRRLEEDDTLASEGADALEREALARVEASLVAAKKSNRPTRGDLLTDIYSPEPPAVLETSKTIASERETSCSRALYEAISEEMNRDETVYLLGEDVTTGGYFAVSVGLVDAFGSDRIVDTPISEYAIVGSAVGAAMTGRRPVAEILFSDFLTTCMDPLINQAAKLRYMSGGQVSLPMVVRTPGGAGLGMAAQHSQSLEALLTGIPGLIVMAPATPYDAKGMLKAAIRSNNPVVFFENKLLYAATGPVPQEEYIVPIGRCDIKRTGRDLTMVTVGAALSKALEAAERLSSEGIEVEVVDARTLVPFDLETVLRSVEKTGRLMTVEDGSLTHGFGAEVLARVVETGWGALVAPPRRVAAEDVPIPYDSALENLALPDPARIAQTARAVVGRG